MTTTTDIGLIAHLMRRAGFGASLEEPRLKNFYIQKPNLLSPMISSFGTYLISGWEQECPVTKVIGCIE